MRSLLCDWRRISAVLLHVVIGVHFCIHLLYLLPINPITLDIAPLVEDYMNPWFSQDWRLFGPDPITQTRTLLVACQLQPYHGLVVESAPVDESTPLWQAQARQRFSSAAWLARLHSNTIQLYLDQSDVRLQLERQRTVEESGLNQIIEEIQAEEALRHTLARRLLARLGAAHCDQRYGANRTIATHITLVTLPAPLFSQRHLPGVAGEAEAHSFGWMPYEPVALLESR